MFLKDIFFLLSESCDPLPLYFKNFKSTFNFMGEKGGGGGVSRRPKCACRDAFFFTFVVPSAPVGWPFFQLWVPPDFFADFSQFFWEYPQIFFRFLSKKMKKSIFLKKKSEKNLDFFSRKFRFFDKKNEKIDFFEKKNRKKSGFFSLENFDFFDKKFEKIWGYSQLFWQKSAKKFGVPKGEKTVILEAHLVRQKWKKGRS